MSIRFDKATSRLILNTKHTQYIIKILHNKYPVHLYYGKKLKNNDIDFVNHLSYFTPYRDIENEAVSLNNESLEYPYYGYDEYRTTSVRIKNSNGNSVTHFTYRKHRVFKGRYVIESLPCAEPENGTQTLEIELFDEISSCTLKLYYTVFEDSDVITRYSVIENIGTNSVEIEKMMSLSLDFPEAEYDTITLCSKVQIEERNVVRTPVTYGNHSIFSRRGASSHYFNPFTAVVGRNTTEEKGIAYGFNLVYSGNFLSEIEKTANLPVRYQTGIGSDNFSWHLCPGEMFETPEAVMTFTEKGIGQMSRNMHSFIRKHILPEERISPRPVVLNSWEAVLFDINEELLINFTDESRKYGIDMLVMDDGWFGKRYSDNAGLGDWYENREKFPCGLKAFVDKVKAKGIKFGIWIEPEMVNPDSDLYRAHPDWILGVPGIEPSRSREQYVLDMSNPDVIDYLKNIFEKTLGDVPIDYIKWDMNRNMSEVGSFYLPAERQGEVAHRYIIGVYSLLKWFRERFKDIMIETCSGGGGRYDLGMMKYGEQIWTSDHTWPDRRIRIQAGSMIAYPASTMSCHVSNPGEETEEMDFRFKVAICGMLGYEFNILNIPDNIKEQIPKQIEIYRKCENLIKYGDFYKLYDPFKTDISAYYYVNTDSTEILLTFLQQDTEKPLKEYTLKIKRAKKSAVYKDILSGATYYGDELIKGIKVKSDNKRSGKLFHFKMV